MEAFTGDDKTFTSLSSHKGNIGGVSGGALQIRLDDY